MQDGDFELHKIGWYTPKIVVPNDFLNEKLTTTQYGVYYSVVLEGDAETYLWQAKAAPVVGERVLGHIEPSASGKSMRFKKDKEMEALVTPPSGGQYSSAPPKETPQSDKFLRDTSTIPLDVYRILINIVGVAETLEQKERFWELVREQADELIRMIDNVRHG